MPGPCWAAAGAAERCPEKFISSATKFLFRSACASGDEAVSITSFLELLAKMKLAVEAGDFCLGESWPSPGGASGPGRAALLPGGFSAASPEDKAAALRCTAWWSGFEGTASLAGGDCRVDRDRRTGFWGAGRSSAPAPAGGSTLTERSRTICSSEGVTMGRLASSLGTGPLLLRDTGSFLASARGPLAAFLRPVWGGGARAEGGGRGGGGGTVVSGGGSVEEGGCGAPAGGPCCWLREETAAKNEEDVAPELGDTFCPVTGAGVASGRLEKQASSGGGKSAMDRSCSSGAGGGGGGHAASAGASPAAWGLPSTFFAGGGGGW